MKSVGTIEQTYQEFKDVAEFRLIYINEAHAADGKSPVQYAKDENITEHDDYSERCTTAQMLMDKKALTLPCLIDGMNNAVNNSYYASPDRIFVVRKDGRLAVAADRGPRGFRPGLDATREWLAEFQATGVEPDLNAPVKAESEGQSGQKQSAENAEDGPPDK